MLARRLACGQPGIAVEVMQACPSLAPTAEVAAEVEEQDELLCGLCPASLPSLANVHANRARAHGVGAATAVKIFVAGSCCPICGRDFRSRLRAIQHLRARDDSSSSCRARVFAGEFAEVPLANRLIADELDRLHRRRCRAAGAHQLEAAGLTCVAAPEAAAG